MYDIGPPGLRSAGSTLKFFKTHHLKCSLQVGFIFILAIDLVCDLIKPQGTVNNNLGPDRLEGHKALDPNYCRQPTL